MTSMIMSPSLSFACALVIAGVFARPSSPQDASAAPRDPATASQPGSQVVSREEALQYLRAVGAAQQDIEIEFAVTQFYGEGQADPPESLDLESRVQRLRVRQICSGQKYRIVNEFVETHENLRALLGQVHIMTWNGTEARLTVRGAHSRDPNQQSARIDNQPSRDVRDLPSVTATGMWVFQASERTTFADLLAKAEPLGPPIVTAEGDTEWTLNSPLLGYSVIRIAIGREPDGLMLRRATQESYMSEEAWKLAIQSASDASIKRGAAEGLILASKIVFGRTRDARTGLSDSALLTVHHHRKDPSDAFWGASEVRIIATRKPDEPTVFLAAFDADAIIGDSRLNIAYQLGSDSINVDGRLLLTHEPVKGDVAAHLSWWIERGRFADADPAGDKGKEPEAKQPAAPATVGDR
jgi:hypothetical protein